MSKPSIADAHSHFLGLVHKGDPAAKALAEAVIDHVPQLDETAVAGLAEFARIAKASAFTAMALARPLKRD